MNYKDEKKVLEMIFEKGIDVSSNNCYAVLVDWLNELPVEVSKTSVSLKALRAVLIKLSKKWDKEIDELMEYEID